MTATIVWLCLCGIFSFRGFSLIWFDFLWFFSRFYVFHFYFILFLMFFALIRHIFDSFNAQIYCAYIYTTELSVWFVYRYRWQIMRDMLIANLFSCSFYELITFLCQSICYVHFTLYFLVPLKSKILQNYFCEYEFDGKITFISVTKWFLREFFRQ